MNGKRKKYGTNIRLRMFYIILSSESLGCWNTTSMNWLAIWLVFREWLLAMNARSNASEKRSGPQARISVISGSLLVSVKCMKSYRLQSVEWVYFNTRGATDGWRTRIWLKDLCEMSVSDCLYCCVETVCLFRSLRISSVKSTTLFTPNRRREISPLCKE